MKNMRLPITISIEETLLQRIESERGLIPRSRFIENRLVSCLSVSTEGRMLIGDKNETPKV